MSVKDDKLNIAMLGHKRIPSREGGIEVVVEELSKRMVEQGHKVTCYNRRGHHISGKEFDSKHIDSYKGVRLKSVFTIDRKGLAAITSSFFAAIRTAFSRYDVVHFHAEGPCAMLWIPKLFRKRCIVTIHGLDWQRGKWKNGFASKYIKFGEKIAAKFADEIIVLSKNVQEYFKQTYGRNTKYIPNGVNSYRHKEPNLIKQKFGLEEQSYILFLGRIVPEKGVSYLIEAYKDINTDKKLVVAGGVSDSDEFMEQIISLAGNDERIVFTDFVEGDVLEELYGNAYIYVLPSDLEGMPISLLEAMSYGNCCLVSDIPECAEVVGNNAVIFKHGDIDDLKSKLQKLCNDKKTVYDLKDSSSDYICKKYNWDNVVKETLKLYEL